MTYDVCSEVNSTSTLHLRMCWKVGDFLVGVMVVVSSFCIYTGFDSIYYWLSLNQGETLNDT